LFGFQHVERVETIRVKAESEPDFFPSIAEKTSPIHIPKGPEYWGIPDILH
jgi:hypothetical protein